MSDKIVPPGRGGAIYEVVILKKGVEARAATDADFQTVRVRAPNAISAQLTARNEHDAALAFGARKVES